VGQCAYRSIQLAFRSGQGGTVVLRIEDNLMSNAASSF